jgi:hypothetical protein
MFAVKRATNAAALALLVVAGMGGFAFGQSGPGKPSFDKLDREQIKLGATSNVKAIGSNFGERLEDVAVTVSGLSCKVMEVTSSYLRFQVPNTLPEGDISVELAIRGVKFNAKLRVVERRGSEPPWNPPPRPPVPKLAVSHFEIAGVPTHAVVKVVTEIPAGLVLELSLFPDNAESPLSAKKIKIDSGELTAEFGPWDKRLPLGSYSAYAAFDLDRQSRVALLNAKWDKLTREQRVAYGKVWARDSVVVVGSVAQRREQAAEVAAHFAELARNLGELESQLHRAHDVDAWEKLVVAERAKHESWLDAWVVSPCPEGDKLAARLVQVLLKPADESFSSVRDRLLEATRSR